MKEKNNFFTHKFLPILSILLLTLFVFTTNVLASDFNLSSLPIDDEYGSYGENNNIYYIVINQGNKYYYYYISTSPFYVNSKNGWCCDSSFILYIYPDVYGQTSGWVRSTHSATTNFMTVTDPFFVASTYDVKNSSGDVVFQGAPQKVEQVTIPKLETAQEIPQMMNKVLQMIIPIGLIVFLIGFLIYLVRLVILRMT